MKLRNLFLSVFAAASILVACNEDEPVAEPSIEVSVSELSLEKAASENTIAVKSNRSWIIDEASEWITVTPGRGGASDDNQVIVVSVPENTGYDREGSFRVNIGFTSKKVIVKQAGSGSYEDAVLYANDFDKEEATQTFGSGKSWPYLDQFEGWKNETGKGIEGITYDFASMSARANSVSNSNYSDYAGSGSNNLFFGANAHFAIKDIALNSNTRLSLSFGTERYLNADKDKEGGNTFKPSEFHVYVSEDNEKWVELQYAFRNGFKDGRWEIATSNFAVPEGTEKISIYFASDIASGHRLDDVTLIVVQEAGTAIDFSAGTAIGQGGGGGTTPPAGDEIFANNFDKTKATQTFGSGKSWPYLDQFDGWKNQTGTGLEGVSYGYQGLSARANSTSDSGYSDYSGSGSNNIFFGTNGIFVIRNIVLGGAVNLSLSFGTERFINSQDNTFNPSEFHVYVSNDNSKWVELQYAFPNGFKNGRWDVATANFSVPSGTQKLSIYIASDITSGHRLDDIKLVSVKEAGTAVDFSAGKALDVVDVDDPAGEGGQGGGGTTSFATAGWLELPETSETDGFDFFSHDGTLSGKKIRNWSFYWDYDNRVSNWVAYPLYKAIYSGASRTDEWGYDPLLPADKQQNVSGGYREGNNGRYSRGHQLPSADRAGYELNSSTFYGTNMTPQNQDFNGGLWADLEGKVRTWAGQSDTCYVVTGCITKDAKYYILDRSGNKVTVPTAYFKAILRYSSNTTIGTDGFCATAFLFDHEEYSRSGKSSLKVNKSMSMSVKELETVLGYKLFVNLDKAIGADKASTVKSENPQNNNWWWK